MRLVPIERRNAPAKRISRSVTRPIMPDAPASTRRSALHLLEPADEPPPSAQLGYRQHQLVAPPLQRKVHGVVLGIDDAEEARIAEPLRATAAVEDLPVQEHAHLVAVPDQEPFHLVVVDVEARPRV